MKVIIKSSLSDIGVTYRTIEFKDKAINNLKIISTKKNIDVRFKSLPFYLRGLHLKYSPITQLKKFYLRYKYKGKAIPLPLGEFIPGHYEVIQVSKEVLSLHEKYYVNGKWKHNPKEQLITQRELELSQELSSREVIQRIVQAQFPRKGKIGKLAKVSQRTFSRFLMGYHERFEKLIFDEDKKGQGTIELKDGLDWKSFWAKYPPENKDPKNSDKEVSVYDSNNLGPVVIDHLTKGVIQKYLECRERSPGTKRNLLDALQCLYSYAENKLKCFGDKPPAVNPTQNIEILRDDDSKFKGSYLNEISFDDDQMSQVNKAIVKIVRKRPFQSEALMLLTCVDIRPDELLKFKKSDLKENYILFRKEIKKDRSKGKVEDTKVYYTDGIVRALDRLDRQYKRKCHQKYRFIPWLIPSDRIDWGNPDSKYRQSNKTRRQSLGGAWEDVRKLIKFEGSIKTLRKTYFTQKVEHEKSKGKTTDEAIEVVAKKSHKGPKMIKTKYNKLPESVKMRKAQELSQVIELKRKKQ